MVCVCVCVCVCVYIYIINYGNWLRRSVTQWCPTLCDPMECSTPDLPVHHQLSELAQTHVHRVSDAIQLSHPLSSPSPPASFPASGSFPVSQFFASGGHSIREAEKSYDLPPASKRPRTAAGVIYSQSQSLRTWRADGVNPSSGRGEMSPVQQVSQNKGVNFSFLCFLSHSNPQWIDCMSPLTPRRATYFTESLQSPGIQVLISPTNTLTDTPRNNV